MRAEKDPGCFSSSRGLCCISAEKLHLNWILINIGRTCSCNASQASSSSYPVSGEDCPLWRAVYLLSSETPMILCASLIKAGINKKEQIQARRRKTGSIRLKPAKNAASGRCEIRITL